MSSRLEYNYYARRTGESLCFGRLDSQELPEYDRFSLPPQNGDSRELYFIKRPEIPELKDFEKEYL